jgi:hypothetical protein
VDSGAADVLIPPSVAKRLVETGTITEADFIGQTIYELADGSQLKSARFYLRELIVGNQVVRNAALAQNRAPCC